MLKSYAFDIDSNLFFTDTTIFMDKLWPKGKRAKIEVSQKEYEEYIKDKEHYRHLNDDLEQSMVNFRKRGTYEKTIFDAISQGKLGPSRNSFLEANRYASPIAEITARWHPVDELKDVHKKIIYDIFTTGQREDLIYSMKERLGKYRKDDDYFIDTYLNNNFYAPCSDDIFLDSIGKSILEHISERKKTAFETFVLHVKKVFKQYYGVDFLSKRKIRMGFSDDSHYNIEGLHHFIYTKPTGLMRKYPEMNFRLYDTKEPQTAPIKYSYNNPDEEEKE